MKTENKYVPDTSVIIEKAVSKLVAEKKIKGTILIPHAVVSELENQANRGQEIGFLGLEELQNLQKLKNKEIELEFIGDRPTEFQIKMAKSGEIDAYIRHIAHTENAILITADKVQAESGKAFGLEVMYLQLKEPKEKLAIEEFFNEHTMSVHLKEKSYPVAKRGAPGNWELVKLSDEKMSREKIENIAKEIAERSRIDDDSFIEISRKGSTVIQHHDYRIVVVRPPMSDGWEITAVRPIKKLKLEDYKLPERILERINKKARGIIIGGETGSGKSTFAQAIAEEFSKNNKIVKTIESPRDLQVNDSITQYSKNFASDGEIHDILLLSRPDNILYDEMRDTPDFRLYTDLRLAGSNMIGVLHAAEAIDGIQRFIERIDTGMIPSVVDTIIFIEKGAIKKILTLKLLVKVPSGMQEADLARPVVEVRDLESEKLVYEIYSYGEQTVVIPLEESKKKSGLQKLAANEIKRRLARYGNVEAEFVSDNRAIVYVDESQIAKMIGVKGKNIEETENELGISLDVRELEREKRAMNFDIREDNKSIILYTKAGMDVKIFIEDEFVFSAFSSKKGEIRVNKKSNIGSQLLRAMIAKKKIEVKV